MKITKLHIDQFKHLENLTFDFTYQSGERKGQPLDKICFIGQSATGKTSLLDVIFQKIKFAVEVEILDGRYLSLKNEDSNSKVDFDLNFENELFSQQKNSVSYNGIIYEYANIGGSLYPLTPSNKRKHGLYFKANLISEDNIDVFTKNPIDLIEKYSNETIDNINELRFNYKFECTKTFDDRVQPKIWLSLLYDVLQYRKKFNQKMSELIHNGLLANPKKLSSEFEKWQKENPNSLADFAKEFNPILKKLHLEIDIVDTKYSIPIRNKRTDEIIPIQDISTGTKGLLLSMLPLFKLDTKDSIILFDEPERSLYPDVQMELMDYYQTLAPDAQIIIATHSPFIAASFEPDERFILSFDENGKVVVNRGVSPIGDDPNDILYNDFGLNQIINKAGQDVYNDYLEKKKEMHFEGNESKKKKLQEEIEMIGDKYNF